MLSSSLQAKASAPDECVSELRVLFPGSQNPEPQPLSIDHCHANASRAPRIYSIDRRTTLLCSCFPRKLRHNGRNLCRNAGARRVIQTCGAVFIEREKG